MSTIAGDVRPGWEPILKAFERNFDDGNELGAAVAIYVDGHPVVDLWGGIADARTGAPWERDTAVVAFSTTKGATALCVHRLLERGQLELDAPVATYWPEFAQAGKAAIPLRWLLSHQAGLPALTQDLTFDEFCAHEPVLRALEAQAPLWEPGTAYAYHAVTFGHLLGEVIRRVTGQTLGQFFHHEIAEPLGLTSWIGLPPGQPRSLAHLERTPNPAAPVAPHMGPDSTWTRAITFGTALPAELINGQPGDFNDPRILALELGGSNMVTDARSLARMYAATMTDIDGVRVVSSDTLTCASEPQTTGMPYFELPEELSAQRPMEFSLGFMGAADPAVVGHGGAGGSIAFAKTDSNIAFSYVMNRMDATTPDLRALSLIMALKECTG